MNQCTIAYRYIIVYSPAVNPLAGRADNAGNTTTLKYSKYYIQEEKHTDLFSLSSIEVMDLLNT